MGLSVYTAPSVDPISLAEAKEHLRETGSEQDGLIAGYILAAREFVENATHRRLITQTLDYTIDYCWPTDGCYRQRIELPVSPVASVTSITYVDGNGATQTLATNQYRAVVDGPLPYIEPSYGVTWPTVREQGAAITVRFVAGTSLSGVPNPLMQAMRMMIGHWYSVREAVNVGNIVTEIPLGVEALLSAYRSPRIAA
jgi:uncharacterized phiE125 gp8 family phage protein